MTFTYFDIDGVRHQLQLKFNRKKISTRVLVCALLAPPMYWPLWQGHAYKAALLGYLLAIVAYLAIQCLTRFRHPLHGVLVVMLLEVIYGWQAGCALAIGGMGR